MLKQRVYTAIALALTYISVLMLQPTWRALAISLPFLIAYWEFIRLCRLPQRWVNVTVGVFSMATLALIWQFSKVPVAALKTLLSIAASTWAIIFLWVLGYPGSAKIWGQPLFKVLQATLLIFCSCLAFAILSFSHQAISHLLFIVALVAAADIGAYFSGKQFGKHKLAANVSPGKTWEGFGGGMVAASLLALLAALLAQHVIFLPVLAFVVLAMICAGFSVIGDLYESMIKRQVDAKDSSQLLPGHGGILDRVDGLMPAVTLYGFAVLQVGG